MGAGVARLPFQREHILGFSAEYAFLDDHLHVRGLREPFESGSLDREIITMRSKFVFSKPIKLRSRSAFVDMLTA